MQAGVRVCVVTLAATVSIAIGSWASAQSADPYHGTWTMNAAKSKASTPLPKSRVVTIAPADGMALKVTVEEVRADDTKMAWSFTNNRDGREGPVTGNPLMDTAATTAKGPRAGLTVYKKAGKVVMEVATEVSADGRTFTTTSKGTDAQGKPFTSTIVYDRK